RRRRAAESAGARPLRERDGAGPTSVRRASTTGVPTVPDAGTNRKPAALHRNDGSVTEYEGAGSRGFEPPVSALTGPHVRPLHHEPRRLAARKRHSNRQAEQRSSGPARAWR